MTQPTSLSDNAKEAIEGVETFGHRARETAKVSASHSYPHFSRVWFRVDRWLYAGTHCRSFILFYNENECGLASGLSVTQRAASKGSRRAVLFLQKELDEPSHSSDLRGYMRTSMPRMEDALSDRSTTCPERTCGEEPRVAVSTVRGSLTGMTYSEGDIDYCSVFLLFSFHSIWRP